MQVHAARYKDEVSEEDRKRQSQQAMEQYPDKVPVICEMHNRSKLKPIPKRKYLVDGNYKIYQFVHLIRGKIDMKQDEALYLFVKGKNLLKSDAKISEIHAQYKDPDDFLYMEYCEYGSFGQGDEC